MKSTFVLPERSTNPLDNLHIQPISVLTLLVCSRKFWINAHCYTGKLRSVATVLWPIFVTGLTLLSASSLRKSCEERLMESRNFCVEEKSVWRKTSSWNCGEFSFDILQYVSAINWLNFEFICPMLVSMLGLRQEWFAVRHQLLPQHNCIALHCKQEHMLVCPDSLSRGEN